MIRKKDLDDLNVENIESVYYGYSEIFIKFNKLNKFKNINIPQVDISWNSHKCEIKFEFYVFVKMIDSLYELDENMNCYKKVTTTIYKKELHNKRMYISKGKVVNKHLEKFILPYFEKMINDLESRNCNKKILNRYKLIFL